MDNIILSICLGLVGLTGILYLIFTPKDRSKTLNIISFSSLAFIVVVILLIWTEFKASSLFRMA